MCPSVGSELQLRLHLPQLPIEAYRGLAILTTNLPNALDDAFLRRLRFIVQFPFPDMEQRVLIWQRIFPTATPTTGLDFQKLARLNVAGGNIRNIALNAAFLAAEEGQPLRVRQKSKVKSQKSKVGMAFDQPCQGCYQ